MSDFLLGGWEGAYSDSGKSFAGPLDVWRGPCVEYIKNTAEYIGFEIEVTESPSFLKNKSNEYFGTTSSFALCVFAASLGVVDLCVAQYSVTPDRSAATDFFVLTSQDIYLIVPDIVQTNQFKFLNALKTILQPLETSTWMFCFFVVLPIMGLLFVFHEYDKPGSHFPKRETMLERDEDGNEEIVDRFIPHYKHALWSLYSALLSMMRLSYRSSVWSLGAKIHLIGFTFFIMTICSAYIANLTAILTERANFSGINSISQVVQQGLRVCSIRNRVSTMLDLYPALSENSFVADPIEEGGDGLPGFDCSNCAPRERTLDFLDPKKAKVDRRYCHVALGYKQDLEIEQSFGRHCNKTAVSRVSSTESGFPVFEGKSKALLAAMFKTKNLGMYATEWQNARFAVESICPTRQFSDLSFDFVELTGIWLGCAVFTGAGLLLHFGWTCKRWGHQARTRKAKRRKKVNTYTQYGEKVNRLDRSEHEWLVENQHSIEFDSKKKQFHRVPMSRLIEESRDLHCRKNAGKSQSNLIANDAAIDDGLSFGCHQPGISNRHTIYGNFLGRASEDASLGRKRSKTSDSSGRPKKFFKQRYF